MSTFSTPTVGPALDGPPRRRRWIPLSMLAAVALPAIAGGVFWLRGAALTTTCNSRLRILALACVNYEANHGTFPPAYISDRQGRPMHSWRVLILPYLDRNDLYSQYNFNEPWDSPQNIKLLDKMPSVFACPSCGSESANSGVTPGMAGTRFTSYAAVLGPRCVFRGGAPVTRQEITDDIEQTLIIGEVTEAKIPWTKPEDIDVGAHPQLGERLGFSSRHWQGLNFAAAWGGTTCLALETPQEVVDASFTRNGGETIQRPER